MDQLTFLYLHINYIKQEIFYVGIGSIERPYSIKNRNDWWRNVVNKYGYEIIVIHENLTWEEACKLEVEYIKQIGRKDLGLGTLVNLTDGGDGNTNPSIETRSKISKALKIGYENGVIKKQRPMLGKNLLESTKLKISLSQIGTKRSYTKNMSIAKKGEKNPMYGKPGPMLGKTHNDETRLKISNAGKGRKSNKFGTGHTILQFDLEGIFIKKFISASLISYPRANIYRCCRGETKTAYGFIWKYENNILL